MDVLDNTHAGPSRKKLGQPHDPHFLAPTRERQTGQSRSRPIPEQPGTWCNRRGQMESFHAAGLADIASNTPNTKDTVFRIGSLTKTFTAIAVMQLWEQGQIDLDAPANDYLRAFKLVPRKRSFRPATVRHLLTHTAGIREMLHLSGLLKMNRVLGEAIPSGRRVPSLADLYRGGLRFDLDPGTGWMYTNHGIATLGRSWWT